MATEISPAMSWKGSFKTTIRHTIMPLIAGAAMAALQSAQEGKFDLAQMKTAAVTALIAGIIRWLQFFATEQKVAQ